MTHDDQAFGQALRPRSTDEVLADDFEHGGAQITRVAPGKHEREHACWHDQVLDGVQRVEARANGSDATGGQPAKLDREQQDEQQTEPEDRHGQADKGNPSRQIVEPRVLAHSGENADRNRDQERQYVRRAHQQQRGRQALPDSVDDALVRDEGVAPVTAHQVADPADVLHRDWIVEAQLLAEPGDVSARDVGPLAVNRHGPAGSALEQHKRHDRHTDEEYNTARAESHA